jgi:hypothetical protein
MKKNVFLLIVAVHYVCLATAQNPLESKLRFIRFRALLLVDEYTRNCALRDNYEVDYFNNVFEIGATINNDILPANALNDSLSIEEYSLLLSHYHTDPVSVDVQAYRALIVKNDLQDELPDLGFVHVDAFKRILSTSKNGHRYCDTLDLRFTIAYDMRDTVFTIKKVSTNQIYGKYVVLGVTNKKEGKEKIYKEAVQNIVLNRDTTMLNNKGEVFLKNIKDDKKYSIEMLSDVYFQTKQLEIVYHEIGSDNEIQSNLRTVHFRKKLLYVRPSLAFFPDNKPFTLNGDEAFSITKTSFGMSPGLDLGMDLFTAKSIPVKVSLLLGARYTSVNYTINSEKYLESYAAFDSNGIAYIRVNELSDIEEKGNYSFIHLPISLRIDYRINKSWTAYAGGGYSYSLQRFLQYESAAKGNYSGNYGPEYFNIVLNENGVYDFGKFDLTQDNTIKSMKQMGILKLDLGASFIISKRLYLETGVSYWHGLNSFIEESEKFSGNFTELNSTYQKASDYTLKVVNFEMGLKYYL